LRWVCTADFSHHSQRTSTISVIIVAGACGIAAGTPLAILGTVDRAARQGAIIKGGLYLELLARIDTMLLDKTGTLTLGIRSVERVISAGDHSTVEVLQLAASVENLSEHPLAAAVLNAAMQQQCELLEASEFQCVVGRGVSAKVEGRLVRIGSAAFLASKASPSPLSK
jgi:cation transport ATPase